MTIPSGNWGWGRQPLFRRVAVAPPPRAVTTGAWLAVALGFAVQLTSFFMVLGVVFAHAFALDSELVTRFEFTGPVETTTGTVTAVRSTASSENKRRVMAIDFQYEAGGRSRKGTSYSVRGVPKVGTEATVEYLERRPEVARVKGLRRRSFGASAGWTLFIPVVGLLFLLRFLARDIGRAKLLSQGQVGYAKLVEKRPTGGSINKQPVYVLAFELDLPPETTPEAYRAAWSQWSKKHRFTFKTEQVAELVDEPEEPVLYLPDKPGSGIPLDALSVTATPEGGFTSGGSGMGRLFLPMLLLVGLITVIARLL